MVVLIGFLCPSFGTVPAVVVPDDTVGLARKTFIKFSLGLKHQRFAKPLKKPIFSPFKTKVK